MEQCIECKSVYEQNESDATKSLAFCSKECELIFFERMNSPIEFI